MELVSPEGLKILNVKFSEPNIMARGTGSGHVSSMAAALLMFSNLSQLSKLQALLYLHETMQSFHDVCKSNHYVVHLKIIHVLYVNYTSIKLEINK